MSMFKFRAPFNFFAVAVILLATASLTQAQATRTWVSGVGDDVNPCSRTAPCKTFAGAISKTAKDGEINVLDSGGFGAVTITKSITIDGAGAHASILASGTNGIVINITDPADTRKTVRLRNLSINGAPSSSPGLNGIRILAANAVSIENVVIDGFLGNSSSNGRGIDIQPSTLIHVHLNRVTVRNCGTFGLFASSTTVNPVVSIHHSSFIRNQTGVRAGDNSRVSVSNSVAANNLSIGFEANATVGGLLAELNLMDSAVHDQIVTARGVVAGGGAGQGVVRLSNVGIHTNNIGFAQLSNGTIISFGNNQIDGNASNTGVLTLSSLQ